ncbi:MAG: hypothetical protein BWY94_01043 [Actinobacteria bacterium ADurb.BinA094]|nr:MAG: hypothetical protein BWY94_01043 [Actinobacteria bacterium ADurb.BinA094]
MSSAISSASMPSAGATRVAAPAVASRAVTTSTGTTSRPCAPAASARISPATATSSPTPLDTPTPWPSAARNALAMAPPMSTVSATVSMCRITPILSETLRPPSTTTNGRAGSRSSRPRTSISLAISSPATDGRKWVTPSVDAWARWAVPNASFTYTSPSDARRWAKASSLAVSSAWKRRFSSRSTSPGRSAAAACSAAGPTQSSTLATGRPSSSESRSATGAMRRSSTTCPLGRPRWDMSTSEQPWSSR